MNPASVERKEIIGLHRITKKVLRNLCKKHQLYQTPELNDVLYLHYQGFQYIECLEEYTELKCLWLECNAISEIQGLENQTKLKCLFLQNNLIKKIENLEYCKELDTLNLASNHIRKIEQCGVDILPVLNTLNLSSNCLRDSESLRGLEECKTLSVLDLANNRIDDILVVKVFAKMPQLRVLVLQGNPVVSKIPQYRKTLILECSELTYLDSRPVFPKDRACAEAWKRGGYNEERKEQERWNRRDRKKIRDSVNATIRMRNKHKSVDEHMDLITSSDSETDEKRRKEVKERRDRATDPLLLIETENDIGDEETLLDVWDEVSGQDGIVKRVENIEEESSIKAEQVVKEQQVDETGMTVELENEKKEEKLEIPERVNMAEILKMVEKPLTGDSCVEDLPDLVSDADSHVHKNISLTEEICVASNNASKIFLHKTDDDENVDEKSLALKDSDLVGKQEKSLNTEEQVSNDKFLIDEQVIQKKRLLIEEVHDDRTRKPIFDERCDNEAQTNLIANDDKTQSLKMSLNSDDKKPLWVDEIFSQSFVPTSTQKPIEQKPENIQISNEIEREIKQGAIKKRRPFTETVTTNIDDFFKPVEKTQFAGEFDLNFDELDAPEPESAEISDFEDVQSDSAYEHFSKSLLNKTITHETNQTEYLEFTEKPQSFFKLSPKCTANEIKETKKQALLIEEILEEESFGLKIAAMDSDDQCNAVDRDFKTKQLLTSLIEDIDEAIESVESIDQQSNNNCISTDVDKDTKELHKRLTHPYEASCLNSNQNSILASDLNAASSFKLNENCILTENELHKNQKHPNEASGFHLKQSCILTEDVKETSFEADFDKLSLISDNIDRITKELEREYNLPSEHIEALEGLLESPSKVNKSSSVSMMEEDLIAAQSLDVSSMIENAGLEATEPKANKIAEGNQKPENSHNVLTTETGTLSESGCDSDSELSNASDDLVSETSSYNEDSTYNKYNNNYFNKPTLNVQKQCALNYSIEPSISSESEDETSKSQYNDAATAICDAVMSRVGEHEQTIVEKTYLMSPIGRNEISTENYEPILEMEKILERLPDDEAVTRAKRLELDNSFVEDVIKTAEEIKYDDECEEVNRQVTKDFEALNANMEYFIEQFQQEQEQMKGELNKNIEEFMSEIDQNKTKVFEKVVQTEQIIFQQRNASEDVQFDFVYGERAITEKICSELIVEAESNECIMDSEDSLLEPKTTAENVTQLETPKICCRKSENKQDNLVKEVCHTDAQNEAQTMNATPKITTEIACDAEDVLCEARTTTKMEALICSDDVLGAEKTALTKEVIFKEFKEHYNYKDKEHKETNTETKLESEKTEMFMENADIFKACGDHAGIGQHQAKEKLPFLELEEILERPTLKAYEKEAIELKALLHKLEVQNEKLTIVKKSCDELLINEKNDGLSLETAFDSEEENTEDLYHDAEENLENATDFVNSVITDIVGDVVDKGMVETELTKPKNYIITDLESDEDYSYSGPPKAAEPPVKSIQSVLGAFHKLIQDIANKNRAEKQSECMELEKKRVLTTETAKVQSLHTLLETPNLLEHHKSSYHELKPQVDEIKKRNTNELKKMVDRVYAQKEKYDDSLELIDGRLMVVKKESGEVEELAEAQKEVYGSDESAEEYESAHSSNENEDADRKSQRQKSSKSSIWDFSMGAIKPHTWVPKYRPTERKSAEQLILNALECNEAARKVIKQHEISTSNCNENNVADDADDNEEIDRKTSVFSNIDEEFFKNLDFNQIAEESSKDENFVEIARSYADLKQIIKKDSLGSARPKLTDEEENIVVMFEEKEAITSNESAGTDEDVLMHKLVKRTKEAKERGEVLHSAEFDSTDKAYVVGDSLEDIKQDFDSDQETIVDEVASNKTLTFEMEPTEFPRTMKVVKMLRKLQIDDPIAQDLLKDRKLPDFGDFTAPLEMSCDSENLKDVEVQSNYAEKLTEYKKIRKEKQLSVSHSEIAIQCEPSSFPTVNNMEIKGSETASNLVVTPIVEIKSLDT